MDENVIKNNDVFYLFIECEKTILNQNHYNYLDYLLGPILRIKAITNKMLKNFYLKEFNLLNKVPKKYLDSSKLKKLNCLKEFIEKI